MRSIYSFQPLGGAAIDSGWEELDSLASYVQHEHRGIFETPRGFTNEWAYHVWLRDRARSGGRIWLGQRSATEWTHYSIDPGNDPQWAQFLAGELPSGAELAIRGQNPFALYNPFEC